MPYSTSLHSQHVVLIVDDDELARDCLRDIVQREGARAILAERGAAAFEIAVRERPCLVLSDVMMPGMDGIELCRKLKASEHTAATPVILITGRMEQEDGDAYFDAGASDYIRKPFDRNEVRLRVRTQLHLHALQLEKTRVQERIASISRAAMDGIVIVDNQSHVTHWNHAAEEIFGYAAQEIVGADLATKICPERLADEYRETVFGFPRNVTEHAIGRTIEFGGLRKSGEEFPVEISLSFMLIDGAPGAVGIIRDITERQRVAQRLRASEAQLKQTLERIPFGLVIVGQDRKIQWVNPAAVQMMGYETADDLCGRVCHGTICRSNCGECPVMDRGETVAKRECTITRRDGGVTSALKSVQRIDLDGEPVLLEAFVDFSDRKALEAELEHARKLEAVGQLAAGIAHEINTPTQFVSDNTAFLTKAFGRLTSVVKQHQALVAELETGVPPAERRKELTAQLRSAKIDYLLGEIPRALAEAHDGLGRISTIVRAMKEFSHPSAGDKLLVDLRDVINTTATVSRNEWKYVAELVTEFDPTLPAVPCLRDEIGQVILNLIVNAAHAIAEANRASPTNKGQIKISLAQVGGCAEIRVSDTGTGIPEAIRERVFEPFFTTKPVGKGTGQGLSIAYSVVVDKHRGTIRLESEVGKGTTFIVCLPLDSTEPASASGDRVLSESEIGAQS
jgi:two-component system, NtrC family, sensor kinase